MKEIIKRVVRLFGFGVIKSETLNQLVLKESEYDQLFRLVVRSNNAFNQSKAQLKQDIFVLLQTGLKRDGFFVEFGATNGVDLSNTYLLEKEFGWKGILAEPAIVWHEDLKQNRNASLEFDCVWSESGKILNFNIVDDAEFSTISHFNDRDEHSAKRKHGTSYEVNTISLFDLLERHNAPQKIDYLSIDTEGSEFEILNNFDFNSYDISVITCEHNYTQDRKKIYELLKSKGYERKFTGLSLWDDWYVKV